MKKTIFTITSILFSLFAVYVLIHSVNDIYVYVQAYKIPKEQAVIYGVNYLIQEWILYAGIATLMWEMRSFVEKTEHIAE